MNCLSLVTLTALFLVSRWIPACSVAFRLKGLGVAGRFSRLRLIGPLQWVAATGLIFLADFLEVHKPAGYSLVIAAATSVVGAFALWRHLRPIV